MTKDCLDLPSFYFEGNESSQWAVVYYDEQKQVFLNLESLMTLTGTSEINIKKELKNCSKKDVIINKHASKRGTMKLYGAKTIERIVNKFKPVFAYSFNSTNFNDSFYQKCLECNENRRKEYADERIVMRGRYLRSTSQQEKLYKSAQYLKISKLHDIIIK